MSASSILVNKEIHAYSDRNEARKQPGHRVSFDASFPCLALVVFPLAAYDLGSDRSEIPLKHQPCTTAWSAILPSSNVLFRLVPATKLDSLVTPQLRTLIFIFVAETDQVI